ncbi:MAG TPA: D-alanyl-D-alanine endopeptidase [Sedimenticola sp.]|nr:D-alanyl-D-alanine endopeptidase [Sedimenticola sp.]
MKRTPGHLLLLATTLLVPLSLPASASPDDPVAVALLGSREGTGSGAALAYRLNPGKLKLRSASALVVDRAGRQIYGKAADTARPIASITKLMTAMVILDAGLPMDQRITIDKADRDLLRLTGSRLRYGATLSRRELLKLALMSSENRAASALARTFPGGTRAFVTAMNAKARALGMAHSRFAGPTGLDAGNVASARDLAKMVKAAGEYPLIREATTTRSAEVRPYRKRGPLRYRNTNRLLKNKAWKIGLSKTGYINEAGRCIVMEAEIAGEPMIIVLLDSFGKLTPFGDSNRIRKWIETGVKVGSNS